MLGHEQVLDQKEQGCLLYAFDLCSSDLQTITFCTESMLHRTGDYQQTKHHPCQSNYLSLL